MYRHVLLSAVYAVLISGMIWAADDDPVEKKLTAAKDEFEKAAHKARAGLVTDLKKKEEAAQKAGELKTLEKVQAEAKGFDERGELPKSVPVNSYESKLRTARAKLEEGYKVAVKEYTKDGNVALAKAVQQELDEFKKTGILSGALQSGTVWVATKPDGSRRAALTVLKRSGNKVTIQYQGPANAIVAEGRIEGPRFTWALADVSKVLKGKPFSGQGELSEQPVKLTLKYSVRGGSAGSVTLVLDKGK